jgi:hypothetical protein
VVRAGKVGYLQMGLPAVATSPGDSDVHSVFYANCLACLIDRKAGLEWVRRYREQGHAGPFGAWESADSSGRCALVCTTDAKAMAVLGLSGGLVEEVTGYLASNQGPAPSQSMLSWWCELLGSFQLPPR